jgi:6-phosphogluconolactonase
LERSVRIFRTSGELAHEFAGEIAVMIKNSAEEGKYLTISLPGGSTPELLFTILGSHFADSVPWDYVHFFWGDERCVSPDDRDSNYGMVWRRFLGKINIPAANIHRIAGESDPFKEAERYSGEVSEFTGKREGIPVFDLVILGLGEDGHTASIFPGDMRLLDSEKFYDVAVHPVSRQPRITMTGRVIRNAGNITFIITGERKSMIAGRILNRDSSSSLFPASAIVPIHGRSNWLLDEAAGSLLHS